MMNTCKGRCQHCSYALDRNLDGEKIGRKGRYRTNLLTLGVFVGHSRGIEGSTHRHPIVRVFGLDIDLITRGSAAQLL